MFPVIFDKKWKEDKRKRVSFFSFFFFFFFKERIESRWKFLSTVSMLSPRFRCCCSSSIYFGRHVRRLPFLSLSLHCSFFLALSSFESFIFTVRPVFLLSFSRRSFVKGWTRAAFSRRCPINCSNISDEIVSLSREILFWNYNIRTFKKTFPSVVVYLLDYFVTCVECSWNFFFLVCIVTGDTISLQTNKPVPTL